MIVYRDVGKFGGKFLFGVLVIWNILLYLKNRYLFDINFV